MYELCKRLFPICRSITGDGVRETFRIIQSEIPDTKFKIYEIPTGTKAFDWTVPNEWNIKDAYILTPSGEKICDFKKNNLHVLHYSVPVSKDLPLSELKDHLYTLADQPDLIPYASSYYSERWGFCLSHNQLMGLEDGIYHAEIDSVLSPGSLTLGELILPGMSDDEVMFSSYTCHPSMANNECSGPSLITYLAKYLSQLPERRYTYRLVLAPETIGAIVYISRNLDYLKSHVKAGFNLTCVGDDRAYSLIHSRYGNTLSDRVLNAVLKYHYPDFDEYDYTKRGSDERQYQAPGVDIPFVCFCRSKYHIYPEYHTSADNLDLISASGLQGSYDCMVKAINALEWNQKYRLTTLCEPQLGKRGLVPTMSSKETYQQTLALKDLIAYSDGTNDLIDLSKYTHQPMERLIPLIQKLLSCGLLEEVK